jgi:hypothetical protein
MEEKGANEVPRAALASEMEEGNAVVGFIGIRVLAEQKNANAGDFGCQSGHRFVVVCLLGGRFIRRPARTRPHADRSTSKV